MKLTIGYIRRMIRESLKDSNINKPFVTPLMDDESIRQRSVYVPDDIKDDIKNWIKEMMLECESNALSYKLPYLASRSPTWR